MNTISSLFTRENINFSIAIISFILSVYNFAHEKLQNRMKLNITYKNHFIAEHDHKSITISLAFENLVKNPISISRIYLCVDDEKYDFYWIPQFVLRATRQTNGEVTDEINVHSIPLPFTIEGYGVVGGFFFTKAPQSVYDLENANTSLLVYSNKGIKTYPTLMNNTSREG